MTDTTGSIELVAAYIEALGIASGARARRRAQQVVNDLRTKSSNDEEVVTAAMLKLAREQALRAETLSGSPLPTEYPTRMPVQAFRYGSTSPHAIEAAFGPLWARDDGDAVKAGGR